MQCDTVHYAVVGLTIGIVAWVVRHAVVLATLLGLHATKHGAKMVL